MHGVSVRRKFARMCGEWRGSGFSMAEAEVAPLLSASLKLHIVDRHTLDAQSEFMDRAHDDRVKLTPEDLGGLGARRLDDQDAQVPVERQWMGVPDVEVEVGAVHFARQRLFCFFPDSF